MLFICYPKCTTCRKAEAWLREHSVSFEFRNIREDKPTEEELRVWQRLSGLPLRKFFNTSGILYRELGLGARLPVISEEEQLHLLASDGMLVRRPILVWENGVLIGFREKEWEAALL